MSTESTKTRRKQVYDMNEWKYCRGCFSAYCSTEVNEIFSLENGMGNSNSELLPVGQQLQLCKVLETSEKWEYNK
ncbi:2105_t:CDS:2 [Rhizophagus irregularis]|nr:2105_t:CDS:2 [Rhizophagus irregularis]